jgi:membrane protein YqaA with SNARE-associated domain
MDFYAYGLIGLFVIAFLSATLIPLASEAVFVGFLTLSYHPLTVFIIATIGNTLGSYLNYYIGHWGNTKWLLRFGVSEIRLNKLEKMICKYGHWCGLMAWIPIIGDPITLAMGFFKTNCFYSLILICIGKALRYLFLWWVYNEII